MKKDIYRERYKYLRSKGYSPTEARRLRTHAIDLGKNGNIVTPEIKTSPKPSNAVKTVNVKKESVKIVPEQLSKNDIYKIRYKIYRELGYSVKEAQKMRSHALDVKEIKIKPDGEIPVHSKSFQKIKNDVRIDINYKSYKEKFDSVENDTVFSRWGMMTQDKRYKDDTEKLAKRIMKNHNLTNAQAHYFLYTMYTNGMSYERAKRELLSNKEFEMYDKLKAKRNNKTASGKEMELLIKMSQEKKKRGKFV